MDKVVHEYLNWWIRQNAAVDAKLPKCLKHGNIYWFTFHTQKANYFLGFGMRQVCTHWLGWPESKLWEMQGENIYSREQAHSGVMGWENNVRSRSWWVKGNRFWVNEVEKEGNVRNKSKVCLGAAVMMQTLAVTREGQTRKGEKNIWADFGSWEWEERCFSKCLFSWMSSLFSKLPKSVIKSLFSLAVN